jgi:hypothetical protein
MVQRMSERLSQQLPESELEYGWNENKRKLWLAVFEKMHRELVDDTLWSDPELEGYVDLVNGMDRTGIVDGDLLVEAAIIAQEMRKTISKRWWPF